MATEDRAILVGISRYSDPSFGALTGPLNDVQRMREWLIDERGGDVPSANIEVLTSPPDFPPGTDPDHWVPSEESFKRAFARIVRDPNTLQGIRRDSRLYLYFSGHGFSERRDQFIQAAVYAANATRLFPNNICGTTFALAAREQAFFKEIVLIMDCCRDAELNLPFSQPAINKSTADSAAAVKFMAIYAAPKGGKAQERVFPELGGITCGLLTHALLRSLREAPPDTHGGVTSAAIKRYLSSTWSDVCGDIPAAEPEFVSPTGADLRFHTSANKVEQWFRFTAPPELPKSLRISDAFGATVVECEFNTAELTVCWKDTATRMALTFQDNAFSLPLFPGLYLCSLLGTVPKSAAFEATGVTDVFL